ncbi:restriction endonuclease subunit S [Vibrio vulnificus]|uniref:restriction endonuclease subunit S n=1 Tax=Vibrio vulnificus TaxID=672 RepID=UPI0019D47874|nr:restriction endonuclease subunit S [Vibrio vulnificus]MBN8104155.1 restriction endonuclease subunit S [Vibrio vulnificus]
MGKYQAYAEYKDSGVNWLGDIPVHWNINRLGQFFEERREKVSDEDYPALSVTMNGIVPQLDTAAKSDAGDNRKKVLKNDFVINSRSDRKGSSGVSPYDGSVSLISIVLEPKRIAPRFAHHLLRSYPFQEEFYRFGKGIVADLWSTNSSEMKNILIPDISEDESLAIAYFLDHETAKIDTLIEKQQQLIKLLKEKRQAVISHAVTKGLNPQAPMKDSGVEWLGEVPEHWAVMKFNHCAQIRNGLVDPKGSKYRDMVLYAPNHIEKATGKVLYRETASEQGADSNKYLCYQGEVIYSKIRPALAKVAICTEELALCSADMYPISCINGLSNEWLYWFMLSDSFTKAVVLDSDRVAMPKVNRESLGDYKIPFPTESEQSDISSHIKAQTQKLDVLEAKANNAIKLMQERRTALISAAVTGKIDVRNWQAPISQEQALEQTA